MSEPTTPLPESPFCRVRARVASIWADGTDAGTSPDWRPAVGEKVTLTPSIGAQLLVYDVAGPEPIIVTVERVQCEVDVDGWLVKSDGRPVYIAPTDDPLMSATGWTWTATIKGKSIVFSAPAGGVVDLALYVATPAVDATEYVSVVQIVADYITANPPDVEQAVADYLTANPPAAAPDATTAAKGLVRLTGDLAGTADAPTVPGLADKADADHDHAIADVTGLQAALDGKQASGSYAAATHTHTAAQVSGLATVATTGSYADLTGKPTIPDSPDDIGAAPAAHDHTAADIDSGAAPDGHVLTADGAGGAAWEAPPAGGGGGSDPWTYVVATVDTTNNTNVAANVAGMSIPGLADGLYEWEAVIRYAGDNGTIGAWIGLAAAPTGATVTAWGIGPNTNNTTIYTHWPNSLQQIEVQTSSSAANLGWAQIVRMGGTVRAASMAGAVNLTLRNESGSAVVSVKADSFIRYRRIAD